MSIEKNVQVVKDFFAAIGRGDKQQPRKDDPARGLGCSSLSPYGDKQRERVRHNLDARRQSPKKLSVCLDVDWDG